MSQQRTSATVLLEMRMQSPPTEDQIYQWNIPIQNMAKEIKNDLATISITDEKKLVEYITLKMEESGRFKNIFFVKTDQQPNANEYGFVHEPVVGSINTPYTMWITGTGAGIHIYLVKMLPPKKPKS